MQRIMLALLLGMLLPSVYASPKRITTFDQLLNGLKQGENISAIISLDHCQPKQVGHTTPNPPDATGGITRMDFKTFGYYKVLVGKGEERYAIATSTTSFTEHREYGLVYNYARLRLFADQSAEFHVTHYHPTDFTKKTEMNYQCRISNEMEQGGVALYLADK